MKTSDAVPPVKPNDTSVIQEGSTGRLAPQPAGVIVMLPLPPADEKFCATGVSVNELQSGAGIVVLLNTLGTPPTVRVVVTAALFAAELA